MGIELGAVCLLALIWLKLIIRLTMFIINFKIQQGTQVIKI